MIRAAFLGTPAEAVPILGALEECATVAVVITRPDKPRGRSGQPIAPEVKQAAVARGLRVEQPPRAADITALVAGCDVAVVAAYGRIIPEAALLTPAAGFINVHFSLLPRWRGASPVVRAILAGDPITGVTVMRMDAGLDTGPTYTRVETPIDSEETAGELTMRLSRLGANLLAARLGEIVAGTVPATPQPEEGVTAAGKVSVDEAHLDPHRHRREAVLRAVRAFNPRPGAWAMLEGERFKVWRARPGEGECQLGEARLVAGLVLLGTVDGPVELVVVQPSGKGEMAATAWMNGRRGEPAQFG
ncbi:MAG TPA: methionyl-tRNA formyltransferase [Acidimicrobiia bacterium]|nr:methionyl-tRNA formyltransferase [Acidimicrobiia bacterium]